MNKKGQTLQNLFVTIILSFLFVILVGAFLYMYGIVDSSLSTDIMAGQVNLSNASAITIGSINSAFLSSADLIGAFFLFGLVISIMVNGYLTRNKTPKIFFVIDFIIMILAYIVAVYISNEYQSLLLQLEYSSLLTANMNATSNLLLNLPMITIATGFITMILAYSGIPRENVEEVPAF